jgi:cysteine synthase
MNFLTRTRVNWEQSIEWAKRMTMMEGIMVGPSSGAVMKVYMCPRTHMYVRILLYI